VNAARQHEPAAPDTWALLEADCVAAMRAMDEASVDAIVTDPPYLLGFMAKQWDRAGANGLAQAWHERWAREALRVLKPGAHLLAFGGTRSYHRLAVGIEDAGLEIRDSCLDCHDDPRSDHDPRLGVPGLPWLYGEGFPKSGNLAGEWEGWGTALKPAFEPIVVARKPLEGTVAANVRAHGTGALHIAACRIPLGDRDSYEHNHSGDRGHGGTRTRAQRGATDLRPGPPVRAPTASRVRSSSARSGWSPASRRPARSSAPRPSSTSSPATPTTSACSPRRSTPPPASCWATSRRPSATSG
jgi:hypothetical protein